MRIINDPKLDFSDVLVVPKRSTLKSRHNVDLIRRQTFKHSKDVWFGVGIIAANMDHTGTMEMSKALAQHNVSTALHKHYPVEDLINFFDGDSVDDAFYSLGIGESDLIKFKQVYNDKNTIIDKVCIDVANGYTERFIDFVKRFRDEYSDITIMAGNVVTPEVTEQLILAGADIVKVGIGSGSCCTTRKKTGVGYPQLSAIIECMDAAHGLGGHICSDGGCIVPGDVSKAFAAGADFVMLGGMLAGHDECDGETVYREDMYDADGFSIPSHMKFYGMSSKEAQDKHNGGVADYKAPEGKSVLVPYKGPVENTIKEILGGIRSACTYTGSRSLKELSKRTTFVLVNNTHNTVYGDE